MSKGTVDTRALKRSVLKHIGKGEYPGAGIGDDYSVMDFSKESEIVTVAAQGFANVQPGVSKGELALIRAINNISLSGAEVKNILTTIIAEEDCPEQSLRSEMTLLSELAKEKGIRIVGGNTAFAGAGDDYSVTVTAFGTTEKGTMMQLLDKMVPGDKVIISGNAGHFGATLLALDKPRQMRTKFADDFIKKSIMSPAEYSIESKAKAFIEGGAVYMHDVSFGGIYRTLSEVAEHSNLGIDIIHENVPIRQDTIEICEFWGINPYMLVGTGALVAVCHEKDLTKMEETLKKKKIDYKIAGTLTKSAERVIHSEKGEMNRSLNLYDSDELYKVY